MSIRATILVVDDQADLVDNIRLLLESSGYQVLAARDGIEALAVLESQPVDLILADIAMPRMNGYQLFERVRQKPEWLIVPFLFLTARALDSDIRYGKELGVDDYLVKPIQPEDLLAAVQGKLRRSQQLGQFAAQALRSEMAESRVVQVGILEVDSAQHQVRLAGETVRLSAREFAVLNYLAQRAGEVVSPQELIEVTHGLDTDMIEAGTLLRPLIRSLRRKLGSPTGEMGCVENVRGVGYRLVAPGE